MDFYRNVFAQSNLFTTPIIILGKNEENKSEHIEDGAEAQVVSQGRKLDKDDCDN